MKNLFDVIDYKFFQIFSGENRRINAEIIMVISDFFKRQNLPHVNKEELVQCLIDYISNRQFENVLDDEGNDISKSTPREKALSKLNLLKRNGWLIEETIENYIDIMFFDNNAITFVKAIEDINNNSTPKEYTGYIFVIESLLKNFDYSQGVSLLERIYDNTETLMNRLGGLSSSIKKYLTNLLSEDSEDAERLLKTLLSDYQVNIIDKAFSNLKLSDNPSKYKNQILTKLSELRSEEGIDSLVENYKVTKKGNESDIEIENSLISQIDYVYNNIETLNQYISMIDIKNAKYVKSTTSKLSFLLSDNFDVVGKIENILKKMKYCNDDKIIDNAFGLYKVGTIDTESIYKPRVFKGYQEITHLQELREVDNKYVNESMQRLFRENHYGIKKINEYVLSMFEGKSEIKSTDIIMNTINDLAIIVLIQLYSHHEQMCYKIESLGYIINNRGLEYTDFRIIKRGEYHAR